MAKVMAVCGKICSGKTVYAEGLARLPETVLLSVDEVTNMLFDNQLGDHQDNLIAKTQAYLLRKAVELVRSGVDVVLDWGFWTEYSRMDLSDFFASQCIALEWHYIEICRQTWVKNIEERNKDIIAGRDTRNHYIDNRLLSRFHAQWEDPGSMPFDVIYSYAR